MPVDVLCAVRNTVWASPSTVLAIWRSRSSTIGFRFCGMMLLIPVRERSSRSHGAGVVILHVHVLAELADADRGDGQSRRELGLGVHGRHVIGVVGVLQDGAEAEQHRKPLPIDGKARCAERRRPERAPIDPRIGFLQPLRIPFEGRREREQVMGERGRLRLHAVRVTGDHRRRVLLGQR